VVILKIGEIGEIAISFKKRLPVFNESWCADGH